MLPKYTSVGVKQAAPVTSFIRLVESFTVAYDPCFSGNYLPNRQQKCNDSSVISRRSYIFIIQQLHNVTICQLT